MQRLCIQILSCFGRVCNVEEFINLNLISHIFTLRALRIMHICFVSHATFSFSCWNSSGTLWQPYSDYNRNSTGGSWICSNSFRYSRGTTFRDLQLVDR